MQHTPVFVKYDPVTDFTTVNGREIKSFQTALNIYRVDRDFNVYLQLCLAYTGSEKETIEFEENKQWAIAGTVSIGPLLMVRLVALEGMSYSIREFETTETKDFLTGWFLYTAQNIKSVRDRSLYISTDSVFFGNSFGKSVIQSSHVIGQVRDSSVTKSNANFIVLDKTDVLSSEVVNATLTRSRILHSTVSLTTTVGSLVSSSDIMLGTLLDSQVTDVKGAMIGLTDNNVSTVKMEVCKIGSAGSIVGKGETITNRIDKSIVNEFGRILLAGDDKIFISKSPRPSDKISLAKKGRNVIEVSGCTSDSQYEGENDGA